MKKKPEYKIISFENWIVCLYLSLVMQLLLLFLCSICSSSSLVWIYLFWWWSSSSHDDYGSLFKTIRNRMFFSFFHPPPLMICLICFAYFSPASCYAPSLSLSYSFRSLLPTHSSYYLPLHYNVAQSERVIAETKVCNTFLSIFILS